MPTSTAVAAGAYGAGRPSPPSGRPSPPLSAANAAAVFVSVDATTTCGLGCCVAVGCGVDGAAVGRRQWWHGSGAEATGCCLCCGAATTTGGLCGTGRGVSVDAAS